jgi:hypothetical protein
MDHRVSGELEGAQDIFLEDSSYPTIAEHASRCDGLFKEYLGIVKDPTLLDDRSARFTLWMSNMGVFAPANVSLDYRL